MPVSKNRKNHKKRSQQFRNKLLADRKKQREALVKLYQENLEAQRRTLSKHSTGTDIENSDIDVDVDINMDNEDFGVDFDVEEIIDEDLSEVSEDVESVEGELLDDEPSEVIEEKPKKRTRRKK